MIRISLISLFFATVSTTFADSITLKSGETIEGTITSETRDSLTMDVPFSPTIMDTRVISKSDIESMDRQTKDQKAFAEILKLQRPDTALDASEFEKMRQQVQSFIDSFPNSPHLSDARKLLAQIQEREARLAKGDVKVKGEWIPSEEYVAEKYQIEATVLADEMQRLTADGNPGAALNLFTEMKKSFPHSIAFSDAVSTAKTAVADLERRLAFELGNLPIKLEERIRTIERTAQVDRDRVRQAMEAENARLALIAEQAKAAGRPFFSISSIDEKGLKLMQTAVNEFKKDLAKPEYATLAANAATARNTIKAIAESDLAAAQAALTQLQTKWSQFEALPRLKTKVAALEAKLTAPSAPPSTPDAAPSAPATPAPAAPANNKIGL